MKKQDYLLKRLRFKFRFFFWPIQKSPRFIESPCGDEFTFANYFSSFFFVVVSLEIEERKMIQLFTYFEIELIARHRQLTPCYANNNSDIETKQNKNDHCNNTTSNKL